MSRTRISRREWLRLSASSAALAALPSMFQPRRAYAAERAGGSSSALVFVHLRGGADGLSMAIPYADPLLPLARPRTALPAGNSAASPIALDAELALHPQLAPWQPWFARGELSVFPAAGFAQATRSHSEAERRLFAAVTSRAREGVLDVQQQYSLGQSASGTAPALRGGAASSGTAPALRGGAASSGTAPALRGGACSRTLAEQLDRLAARLQDSTQSLAWVELGGFDTHVAQRARLDPLLAELGTELSAFYARLSTRIAKLTVVAVSELGRSVLYNGTSGTDDGHAGAVFALSNVLAGGVHGGWPGLLALRDGSGGLLANTDLDGLIAQLVATHGLSRSGLEPRS